MVDRQLGMRSRHNDDWQIDLVKSSVILLAASTDRWSTQRKAQSDFGVSTHEESLYYHLTITVITYRMIIIFTYAPTLNMWS